MATFGLVWEHGRNAHLSVPGFLLALKMQLTKAIIIHLWLYLLSKYIFIMCQAAFMYLL